MSKQNDRVRANTSDDVNNSIDQKTEDCIAKYATAGPQEIGRRIQNLEREWDVERWLELNASSLAFIGLALGVTHSRKWLFLPGLVLPFLFEHAVQGWCPPLPVLRRLGVRTRQEIDREKYALKALRGDFQRITRTGEATQAAG
jgi:hypothetical protein